MVLKGSLDDVAFLVVAVFIVGLILVIVAKMGFDINDKWQTLPQATNESKTAMTRVTYSGFDTLFNMFPILFFGIYGIALLLASRVETHPVFLVFSFIIMAFLVVVGSIMGYVFSTITHNVNFLDVITRYPATDFIFSNYAGIVTAMCIVMIIVLYAKLPNNSRMGRGIGY
jgi:hypothetical protein